MTNQFNKNAEPHNFHQGQSVWLQMVTFLGKNRKLSPKYSGPYVIQKITKEGAVDLIVNGRKIRVNVSRLKPYLPSLQQQQQTQTNVKPVHERSTQQTVAQQSQ